MKATPKLIVSVFVTAAVLAIWDGPHSTPLESLDATPFNESAPYFEANHGQADDRVEFLARGKGYTIYLASTEEILLPRQPDVEGGN